MSIIQAIVLGLIQGITEFLPVSSSGHLIFLPAFFGWEDQGVTFDLIVHLGTLSAIVFYFREKLWLIVKSFLFMGSSLLGDKLAFVIPSTKLELSVVKTNRKLGVFLILSFLPVAVVGFLLDSNIRSFGIIGWSFIIWGVVLWIADRYSDRLKIYKSLDQMTFGNAMFIGFAQVFSLVAGTSRSGITMTAGLFAKFSRKDAAEFSFLMSIPVIAASGMLSVVHILKGEFIFIELLPLFVGFVVSAISALVVIFGFLKIIEKWSFTPFVIYRILVGVAILVFLV